ncbi:uncharacterized protein LOC110458611 isoform X2 [Mizuhopecten yessoensis]|uniref:uncharacterized protein LOC110458611 isoform X2 n=1 Tax=Mizuhopecten yessoensis TaxID=6573 RepID=UPI000B458D0B|nr:uncharacterized protein LOC110458611 isoform X2 [Mizuhopecten yessoensis]
MDIKGTIVLLNVLALALALADNPVYRKFPCLMARNRYYHKQLNSCRPCDRCLPGEGIDSTAQVEVHEKFGALKCRSCLQCEPGTYNTRRAFKCKSCRDCAASGRTVKTACAPNRNAVCGKRIKVKTTITSEQVSILPTEQVSILPTHHPPSRDRQPDRIVKTDYRNDLHTHINISALAVALVGIVVIIIIAVLGVAFYRTCYGGNRGCSLGQTNTVDDSQPIVTRSGSGHNTTSVVSEMQPQTPRPKRVADGINNNVYTTIEHEVGDKNACGIPYAEYRYTQHPFDQNSGTRYSTDSRAHGYYTAIRQEEHSSTRNTEHSNVLSSDVEEDAVPSIMVFNETSATTGRVNAVRYTATPMPSNTTGTTPSNNLPTNNGMYHDQAAPALYHDSKSTSEKVSADEGKRKTDRKDLEKFVCDVSKYIGTHETYQILGRHLNVSTTDIDIIKEEHEPLTERGYRTLRKWMECQPEAGIDDLKKGISDIGRKDILDKVRSRSY